MTIPALELRGVTVMRDGRPILDSIDWTVGADERWIVLGPNGAGKTTLCQVASLYQHPARGSVHVLGERLGRTEVRELRKRIGYAGARLAQMLRPDLIATDAVVTAKHGALATWWHTYTEADYVKARRLLARFGCEHLTERRFGTLASGERKRVEIARALMSDPDVLLLDEPAAGLDLAGRETLVGTLAALAGDSTAPATVLVTHHVDEIPPGFTHVLLLAGGRRLNAGPLDETLTGETLSCCFGLALAVERRRGRWQAWAK
ncbi:MAG: ABC transporter ATP-binding protein [Vicinamibacterales bacterium]|nr:ABC transporter ATP-binding protein [Vicinamibacterales bacterium]